MHSSQEVEAPIYEQQLRPFLQALDYDSLFNPRALPPGVDGPAEGVSLAWRRSAFDLLGSASFEFSGLLGAVLPPGADSDPLAAPLLRVARRRGEGAAAALLQYKPTARRLLAAATHLFWDPHYPDVKVPGT
jgi:mRNA deadenylase 3'-5' endonuclease subunit Ccr4